MKRSLPIIALVLIAASPPLTPKQCQALAEPAAVIKRCYGGNFANGQYVGDLRCWPFSELRRYRGLWHVGFETSDFYPNAKSLQDMDDRQPHVWLSSEALERNPAFAQAVKGPGSVYALDLQGREALCDGMFGHFGMYPREIIAERLYSSRLLIAVKR